MLFSSIPFLYYFLPIVMILYFIAPKQLKNAVLLSSSLMFYAWGEPKYVILMMASICIGYVSGILIEAFPRYRKATLIVSIALCVISLGYFKYANFFLENFAAITGLSIPTLKITLPIGISFYTFQIISYIVDVYRKDVPTQRNIINLAAYVAMFPQLIAGPIVRYIDVNQELNKRTHSIENFAIGSRQFILGLSKKILIANSLGELCDIFKLSDEKSILFYWLYAVAFSLHIYFDFSGYSDMAIGLGKIFGFNFLENFNYPFISKSVTEFWRRWHMSLGSWFRDYVYIPLGGNRVSKLKHLRNILIVWMLTGFWHGASWNFIIWGLIFAVFLIIEKMWLLPHLNKAKVWNRIYVVIIVIFTFVIFNATGMTEALEYIKSMCGIGSIPICSTEFIYCAKSYLIVLIIALVGATPIPKHIVGKLPQKLTDMLEPVVLISLLIIMTAYLVDGSFNPFLYFRF